MGCQEGCLQLMTPGGALGHLLEPCLGRGQNSGFLHFPVIINYPHLEWPLLCLKSHFTSLVVHVKKKHRVWIGSDVSHFKKKKIELSSFSLCVLYMSLLLARGILSDAKCPIMSCKFKFVSVDYLTYFHTQMLYSWGTFSGITTFLLLSRRHCIKSKWVKNRNI